MKDVENFRAHNNRSMSALVRQMHLIRSGPAKRIWEPRRKNSFQLLGYINRSRDKHPART